MPSSASSVASIIGGGPQITDTARPAESAATDNSDPSVLEVGQEGRAGPYAMTYLTSQSRRDTDRRVPRPVRVSTGMLP